MKKFLYNTDKSQVLVSKSSYNNGAFFLLQSELDELHRALQETVNSDKTNKAAKSALDAFERYINTVSFLQFDPTGQGEERTKAEGLRQKLLTYLNYMPSYTDGEKKNKQVITKNLTEQIPHTYLVQSFFVTSCVTQEKLYGRNARFPLKVATIIPASSVSDATPVSRLSQSILDKHINFEDVCKQLHKSVAELLTQAGVGEALGKKMLTLNWQCHIAAKGVVDYFTNGSGKNVDYSMQVPFSVMFETLTQFNNEMSNFLNIECPDLKKIDAQEWSLYEWNGSLDQQNIFSVKEAFYLVVKNQKGEGFLGMIKSQHQYKTLFKMVIVKDIANATLWHEMPEESLLADFDSVSKVNVSMSFENVDNPDMCKSTNKIQAYIEKSKLENSLAVIVPSSSSTEVGEKPKKTNNKI